MLTNTLFRSLINDYSKTENINIDTFDKFLIDLNLRDEFHEHNVNKIKGFIFEYITKYEYLHKNFEAYLFNEIPSDIRNLFNLGMKDNGIDILYKDNDTWISVQCKWREKINLTIDKNQILGFLEEAKQFNKRILVTNVRNKNKYIQDRYDIGWILRKDFQQIINREFINFITNEIQFKPIIKKQEQFILRNCQKYALKALNTSNLNRKQCIMFCGTGKSIVMIEYILLKNFNRVVVLMPSLQLIGQFYNNLKKYCKNNVLCICSSFDKSSLTGDEVGDKEGDNLLEEYLKLESKNITYTTKPNIIAQELKKNNLIVLCTYQSSQLLKDFRFDLGLFDEAHRTVNSDSFGFTLTDKNCHINERVFFTATPKYYKGNNEKCVSMDNKLIYGEEVFNYPYFQAKNDGYVLDFQVITYVVPENMNDIINELYIKKDNLNVKSEILIGALIIAQHINSNNNSKKILTYHNTINNAIEFKKTLAYVFIKFNINAKLFSMCGNTSITKRKEIFNEYETSNLAIICSSRVLNEGVDLPCTDTIAFIDPRSSTIDVTQCFGRADRIFGEQTTCSVIIPVHYNQLEGKHNYSDTIKILTAMSEVDNKLIANYVSKNINNKISIIQMNSMVNCNIETKYNFEEVMKNLNLAICASKTLNFEYKMNLLFNYCDKYKCCVLQKTIYEDIGLGSWMHDQKKKINSINDEVYKKLSENKYVKENLDDYLKRLDDNKDKEKLSWEQWHQLLLKYIIQYKKVPIAMTKYENQNIGDWLGTQRLKINSVDDDLYKRLSTNEHVKKNLDEHLVFIEKNKDREKLSWEQWKELLFAYCDKHESTPSGTSLYDGKHVGSWLNNQKNKIDGVDDILYKELSSNKYVKEHLDNYLNPDAKWEMYKQLLFEYSDAKEKFPKRGLIYKEHNIGNWLQSEKSKINSIDDELYKKLSANKYVKKSLDKYFINVEKKKSKVKLTWDQWLQLVFIYSDLKKETPIASTVYENQNIGKWLCKQRITINSTDDELYKKLSANKYVKLNVDKYLENKKNKQI